MEINVKFVTYNVRNLFDNVDDPYLDDGPPKSEKEKLALADVIRKLDADILALQEVENEAIVREVLSIAGLGNKYNIIVGKSDGRGIACALLISKKYPVKSYNINEGETLFYRPPVEAIIELLPSFSVRVFSVHYKAKMDQASQEQRKKEALRTIELTKNSNLPTIIMGDFNDLPESVVSQIFNDNGFIDVRAVDKESKDVNVPTHFSIDREKSEQVELEEIYEKGRPSIVDYIRINPNLTKNVVQGSFDVVEKHENPNTLLASDHLPVSVVLKFDSLNLTRKEVR